MRISTTYQYDSYTHAIDLANQRVTDTQQQLLTGKRINKPSDDPYGTTAVIKMQSLQAGLAQYATNLQTAKGTLGESDSALGEAGTLLNSAYTIALSGANAATDPSAMQGLVAQVTAIQSRLVQLANTQGSGGQYIFAGQKNNVVPYTAAGGVLTFNGDTNQIQVEVGPNDQLKSTTDASNEFTTAYGQLETLKNNLLSGNLTALSSVSVADMSNSAQAVQELRGDVGTRLQSVSDLTSQNGRRTDDLTTQISNLADADASVAITKYQSALTAYQAALSVANSGLHLSLMDYLKI